MSLEYSYGLFKPTGHEQTKQTEFAIFISFMLSLLPKDLTHQNLYIFTAAAVLCAAGVKRLPVHHYRADYIFLFFGIIEFMLVQSNFSGSNTFGTMKISSRQG